jgi:hypothetical protein
MRTSAQPSAPAASPAAEARAAAEPRAAAKPRAAAEPRATAAKRTAGSTRKRGQMAGGITSQSRKAKGRKLQQLVEQRLKLQFPHLRDNDIRSTSMGCAGDDLILSPHALECLPYNFEMKWHEKLSLWETMRQVMVRYRKNLGPDDGSPLTLPAMVVKRNNADPLAVIPFGHMCNLLRLAVDTPSDAAFTEECVLPMLTVAQVAMQLGHATAGLRTTVISMLRFALRSVNAVHAGTTGPVVSTTPAARFVFHCHDANTLNLWAAWDALPLAEGAVRAIVFNRGELHDTVFVALPFETFVTLVHGRWRHVARQQLRRLQQALADVH